MSRVSPLAIIDGKITRVKIENDDTPNSPRDWDNLGTMVCWHRNYNLGDEQPKESPDDYRRNLACQYDDGLEDRLERIAEKYENAFGYKGRSAELYRDLNKDLTSAIDAVLDKHFISLPLYLYDHSGITMNTGGFGCPWDSGQVGFIYVTKAELKAERNWKRLTPQRLEDVCEWLTSEVEVYAEYLEGNVYGYVVEQAEIPNDYRELALIESNQAIAMLEKYLDVDDDLDWSQDESCWGFYGYDIEKNGILDYLSDAEKKLARRAA